jgi:hypothetical protein
MATIAASSPTLSNVSGAVIVEIMSAPTSNSSPSRMPRPLALDRSSSQPASAGAPVLAVHSTREPDLFWQ